MALHYKSKGVSHTGHFCIAESRNIRDWKEIWYLGVWAELGPWGLSGKNLIGFLAALVPVRLLRRAVQSWVMFYFIEYKFFVFHTSQSCLVRFEIIRFSKMMPFNSLPVFPGTSEHVSWPNVLTNDTYIQLPPSPFLLSLPPNKETAFDSLSLELCKHSRADKLPLQVSSPEGGLPGHLNQHAPMLEQVNVFGKGVRRHWISLAYIDAVVLGREIKRNKTKKKLSNFKGI